MVRLEVIEQSRPSGEALEALKGYAAVSDAGQEHLLSIALNRAFGMVQRFADVALLAGTYCVKASDHDGEVRVYMGGKVTGVTDAQGAAVQYSQRGDVVHVNTRG